MKMELRKVVQHGKALGVNLPAGMLKHLRLRKGDFIGVSLHEGHIRLSPSEIRERD